MRNEIWSSHVIIQSVSTKNFPASFILSKYAREKHEYVVYLTWFSFYCMKRNSHFNLLFWQTKVCRSLDTSGKHFRHLNTKRWHWPHSNIWKATTQRKIYPGSKKSPWKYWYCSIIPAICPQCFIFLLEKVTCNESRWWCMTLETTHERN